MVEESKDPSQEDDHNLFNDLLERLTFENLTDSKRAEFYVAIAALVIAAAIVFTFIRCLWKLCGSDHRNFQQLIQ